VAGVYGGLGVTIEIVSDLLVPQQEAKKKLRGRLDLLSEVRSNALDPSAWYDGTIDALDAAFASKASNYFSTESGFQFVYIMNKGRQFRGANFDRTEGILNRMIGWLDTPEKPAFSAIELKQSNKVFIVHGHDEKRLLEVKEILKSQNLIPVVLKDEPNGGATIIEKFEKNSDVGFAVVLVTADDVGSIKSDPKNLNHRARQNVILELGYFIGRLTRARICALNDSEVELPSDIHGVIYTRLDSGGAWRYSLLDELKHAGFPIDKNKL
jgi:predicted nucleotide-binding protein